MRAKKKNLVWEMRKRVKRQRCGLYAFRSGEKEKDCAEKMNEIGHTSFETGETRQTFNQPKISSRKKPRPFST